MFLGSEWSVGTQGQDLGSGGLVLITSPSKLRWALAVPLVMERGFRNERAFSLSIKCGVFECSLLRDSSEQGLFALWYYASESTSDLSELLIVSGFCLK